MASLPLRWFRWCIVAALAAVALPAAAQGVTQIAVAPTAAIAQGTALARQDLAVIHKAVEQFLRRETQGLPGQVSHAVGAIDARLSLAACPAPEVFLPPGARLWGQSTVSVRCMGASPWQIYVPVTVRVAGTYYAAARALAQGQTISADDLLARQGDLTQLPGGAISDPALAIGRTVAAGIAAGLPLRTDLLRAPLVVQQGQTVQVVSRGRGFSVTSEGRAVTHATLGQVAQVRTATGQTVSGIARADGMVEVSFK